MLGDCFVSSFHPFFISRETSGRAHCRDVPEPGARGGGKGLLWKWGGKGGVVLSGEGID
jgi:hypothetical protein